MRSERPFASAPPDGGEADSCREWPSRRLSERDSGSASALVGGLGTDWTRHREEGPMRQCQSAPMVAVYLHVCGTSISSVSHWTISGELPNCDLRNYGDWRGPKGPSLPLPRTEARLTRVENGRRLSERDSGPASALVGGIGTDRSQRREERTNETMPKCPNGSGLSPRMRGHRTGAPRRWA